MSWLVGRTIEYDKELSPEQNREKLYIIKAEEAIHERSKRNTEFYERIAEIEQDEIERNGISDYDQQLKLWQFCGEIPIKKVWFQARESEVDDTTRCNFWCWEEDHDIDEDWYTKGPEDFNKTKLLLTPGASEREYGRVFFDTVTKYIPKDQVVPSSLKQVIKGLLSSRRRQGIRCLPTKTKIRFVSIRRRLESQRTVVPNIL